MSTIVHTDAAPAAIGPYSQAVIAKNGTVYVSGQIPLTPAGELVEGDIVKASEQALQNMTAILTAAGCTLDDVVKTNCYLKDMNDFAAFNEVYSRVFGSARPARAAIQPAVLPRGAMVEIEAIAIKP